MKKSLFISLALISSTVPFIASAQSKITELGNSIKAINSSIVVAAATLFMALATAAFFFGMAKFIYASREGDQKEITNGKQFMLWSVIALFVMFSIYGIIDFGQGIFDIKGKTDIVLPSFKIGGSTVGGGGGWWYERIPVGH
jgi:L-cystine uptake protein TcyP (sodium:dicarboxylate symporter family)